MSEYRAHRGFNAKAREILLEPEVVLDRKKKDEQHLTEADVKKMMNSKNMSMKRTDSNLTTDSVASNGSSKSMPVQEEFDCIGEDNNNGQQQVANKRLKKFLGEIGKTRSEADFFNGKPTKSVVKTFKQQNLIKLPSMENDLEAQNRINGLKMLDEVVDVASISRANKYKQ